MATVKNAKPEIEPQYKKFGDLVRAEREKKQLSQKQLSEKLGFSRVSLANIESGRQRVMLLEAIELANLLEFSLYDLQMEFSGDRLEKKVLEQPKKVREALLFVRNQFRDGKTDE